jgi:hypothetical protein
VGPWTPETIGSHWDVPMLYCFITVIRVLRVGVVLESQRPLTVPKLKESHATLDGMNPMLSCRLVRLCALSNRIVPVASCVGVSSVLSAILQEEYLLCRALFVSSLCCLVN